MGKKKSYDLSEDSKIREVSLHHHRFSRFLRFLKEKKAIIEFADYDKVTNEKFTLTYSSDKDKSHLTIENLVSYSLRLSENQANDYIREKLGLDDKHSGGDRVNSMGRIIESITVYYDSGLKNSFPVNIFSKDHLFSYRDFLQIEDRELTTEDKRSNQKLENFILYHPLKESRYRIVAHFDFPTSIPKYIRLFDYSSFPYKKQLYELLYYMEEDSTDLSIPRIESFMNIFRKIDEYYSKPISYDGINIGESTFSPVVDLIIPDHIDFKYAYDKKYSLEKFARLFRDIKLNELSNYYSIESLIKNRYAILWHLTNEKYPVMKWNIELQGILLITALEHKEMFRIVHHVADYIFARLRFELVASAHNNKPNYQEHSITAENLCKVLEDFMFPKGLDATLKINGNSILEGKIIRYPEPDVAIGAYDQKTIYDHLKKMIRDHIIENLYRNLYLPKLRGYKY